MLNFSVIRCNCDVRNLTLEAFYRVRTIVVRVVVRQIDNADKIAKH